MVLLALSIKDSLNMAAKLLAGIRHRGPDHSGIVNMDSISLGMCQLQIRMSLEKNETIPFVCQNGRLASYNGEVYRDGLFSGGDEAEFLVGNIFDNQDTNCMAAIAVKERDSFILYRDKYGIKPLFYMTDGANSQSFSSEMLPLCSIKNSLEVNYSALNEIVCFGNNLGEETLFKNIYSVAPGEMVTLTGGKIEHSAITSSPKCDRNELLDRLRDSVKACTDGCRKKALALSSGIDSKFISFILNELDITELDTISIHIEGSDDYIESLDQLSLPKGGAWEKWTHHVVEFTAEDFKKSLKDSIETYGMPTYMTSVPLYYTLAKSTHEFGCVVMLTGEGADEFFLGYNSYKNIGNNQDFLKKLTTGERIDILKELFGEEYINDAIHRFCLKYDKPGYSKADYIRNIEKTISLQPLLQRQDHIFMRFGIEGRTPFLHSDIPEIAESFSYDDLVDENDTKVVLRCALKKFAENTNRWLKRPSKVL